MSEMELPEEGQEVEELESQSVEEDSQENSTIEPEPKRQPERPAAQQQRVNLDDLPEFRRWKSAQDQRIAELQRKAEMAERAALERMTPQEKQQYEGQTLQQRLEEAERRLQEQEQMNQWIQYVEGVRQRTGNPPLSELDQSSPQALMESAYEWKLRNELERAKAERRSERSQANAVDTGSSRRTIDPADKWEKAYAEAKKNRDTRQMLRIQDEAALEGIYLNEYTPPVA